MSEAKDYQMAIDLLCCHLGLSEEEAKHQLGLNPETLNGLSPELSEHLADDI
ncbi:MULTISPECIES: hypothetical protein [unclassified Vibrio]|uniref:Heat-shock protein HtpX n=1 Tax=Vibrio sp. HB236076 TaxID=3232307 RepID=A0AB39HBY0_9VIBR|nr:hypothetical protein [Vibrio sp. HB161653]MDP5253658.1 hypothetical protein [Vibrio sp. HB161653]